MKGRQERSLTRYPANSAADCVLSARIPLSAEPPISCKLLIQQIFLSLWTIFSTAETVFSLLSGKVLRLDARHVLVAKAEMVADLVDQHVADDAHQILAGLAPIIEDRPAIEKDHI
jgi:hypothetical protein